MPQVLPPVPQSEFEAVGPPWWDDRPVLIVGCGPSLADVDMSELEGLGHILAVKGAMFDLPFAEIGFGIDLPRMREWHHLFGDLPFPVWWAVPDGKPPIRIMHPSNVHFLKRVRRTEPLTDDPGSVVNGGTSGYSAVNFAVHKRAKQIVLFGFDYSHHKGHWHYRPHHRAPRPQRSIHWANWGSNFAPLVAELKKRGIELLNASEISTIRDIERCSYAQAVSNLRRLRAEGSGRLRGDSGQPEAVG